VTAAWRPVLDSAVRRLASPGDCPNSVTRPDVLGRPSREVAIKMGSFWAKKVVRLQASLPDNNQPYHRLGRLERPMYMCLFHRIGPCHPTLVINS